ncbi:hypothetical protein JNM05_02060 [bacterium]|nr:hypothetical protein [bacterium]
MRKIFLILVLAFTVSCGSSQSITNSPKEKFNFTQFGFSKKIDLKQAALTSDELLPGYQLTSEMLTDPDARYVSTFYYGVVAHAPFLGSVVEKSFQSIDGPDRDCGSIMYFEFDREMDAATYTYLNRLFWGKRMTPSSWYSPEFFMSSNTLVVWCLPMKSPIKEQSQKKLFQMLSKM